VAARDVLRRHRPAVGAPVAQHAGPGKRPALSRDLPVRGHQSLGGTRHAGRVQGDRRALARYRRSVTAAARRRQVGPGRIERRGGVGGRVHAEGATDGKYDGVELRGIRLRVTDRRRYDPTRAAVLVLTAIEAARRDSLRFDAARFDRLAEGGELRRAVLSARAAGAVWRRWDPAPGP